MTDEMRNWMIQTIGENGLGDNHGGYKEQLQKGLEDISRILGQHSLEELEIEFEWRNYTFPEGDLLTILGLFSTSLKSLRICDLPKSPATSEQILQNCPFLTKLSIGQAPEWIFNRILSACPNLEEIEGLYDFPLTGLEKSYGELRKISGYFSNQDDLEMLWKKSGNLTELNLILDADMEHIFPSIGVAVLEFVQSKRESLKVLELKFQSIPKHLRLGQGFSQLTKLHLDVGNCPFQDLNHFVLDICFSRDTPQLKYFQLFLFGYEYSIWKDIFAYRNNITKCGRVIPLRTLTHLGVSIPGRGERECANYLRQLFPALTSLIISRPSEDFLRGVYQMKNLVDLRLRLAKSDAYGRAYRRAIEDLLVALFGTPLQDQEGEDSILNLTKLRYLSISHWNEDVWRIPEEIVRNGFGNMKRLAVLKLPKFYMTPEGSAFLRANLPYLKQLTVETELQLPHD